LFLNHSIHYSSQFHCSPLLDYCYHYPEYSFAALSLVFLRVFAHLEIIYTAFIVEI